LRAIGWLEAGEGTTVRDALSRGKAAAKLLEVVRVPEPVNGRQVWMDHVPRDGDVVAAIPRGGGG
jgi:hypothetical protein